MSQAFLLIALFCAAAVQIAVVISPGIPLGIPGEWEWPRHEFPELISVTLIQFFPAAIGLTMLLTVAKFGINHFVAAASNTIADPIRSQLGPSRKVTVSLLLSLAFVSWCWIRTCERSAPAPQRNIKSLAVLYSPNASGYFYEAVFQMPSADEFLRSYPARMREGDVLHVGTHPPGLFLLSKGLLQLTDAVPQLSALLQAITIRGDVDLFREWESQSLQQRPLTESERNALILLAELTLLAAVLTVIPIYYAIRLLFDPVTAWRTAVLWATFPCISVFLPKSDVLFTFTSMTTVCLGLYSCASDRSLFQRMGQAVLAGTVLWCGLMLSLAHLPVLAIIGAFAGLRTLSALVFRQNRTAALQPVITIFVIIGTVAGLAVVFGAATGCNMFEVWQQNLKNHAGFYEQYPRTVSSWMMVNPLELAFSIGLPAALIGLIGLFLALPQWRSQHRQEQIAAQMCLTVTMTVGALWLSGRNSGEAARLWCFLTPWLLIPLASVLRRERLKDGMSDKGTVWNVLLILQMIVCALTTGRVDGFDL